jgi:DNA mismatch repair protein MSH6
LLSCQPRIHDFFHIDTLISCFRKLPDLERIISRIHAGTCRVKDFVSVLTAFQDLSNAVKWAREEAKDLKSRKLHTLLATAFPDILDKQLDFFDNAFDKAEALATGDIVVENGFDEVFDEACERFDEVREGFDVYRREQESALGGKRIVFKDMGKDLFQMEVQSSTKVPKDWKQMSKTKVYFSSIFICESLYSKN